MRTFKIHPLSNFQVYNTIVLTIIIHFAHRSPTTSANYKPVLCISKWLCRLVTLTNLQIQYQDILCTSIRGGQKAHLWSNHQPEHTTGSQGWKSCQHEKQFQTPERALARDSGREAFFLFCCHYF